MSACASLAAVPEPFSFVHDAKLAWNKKLPVSWVEKDGAKVLKMEGGSDGRQAERTYTLCPIGLKELLVVFKKG